MAKIAKELKLSDGRIATIKEGKGKDLFWALEMATSNNEIAKLLLVRLVQIDGKDLTEEELENLPLADVLALMTEVTKQTSPLSERKQS